MTTVATIGYEATTMTSFLAALGEGGVEVVVDIRAVASSRRPGFAKTKLAANLAEAGIGYIHLRGLGTPADGRAAARAGRHAEMRAIFLEHMRTEGARTELERLVEIVRTHPRIALLCFEASPTHCHRQIVADALVEQLDVSLLHLRPEPDPD